MADLAKVDWTEVLEDELARQGLRHSVLIKLDRASLWTYAEAGSRVGDIDQVLEALHYMYDMVVEECPNCGETL